MSEKTPMEWLALCDLTAAKATQGEWSSDADDSPNDVTIWGPSPEDKFLANVGCTNIKPVQLVFDIDAANGRHVVNVVNAYPHLAEALRRAVEVLREIAKPHEQHGAFSRREVAHALLRDLGFEEEPSK